MRAENQSTIGRAADVELSGVALHACRGHSTSICFTLC